MTSRGADTEAKLIVQALGDISAGTQASADFFNQGLPEEHPARVSRQTVWYWANGSMHVGDSRLRFWKHFLEPADKRYGLALAILELREEEAASFIERAHWVGKEGMKKDE